MGTVRELIGKVFRRKKEPDKTVLQVLGDLPEEYSVFSSILYDNSDIDHVVFSRRQGLFLVNVANDKGTVTYDGTHLIINKKPRSDSIKKALKNIFWLKSILRERIGLNVPITPIVVFRQAKANVNQPVVGVMVMESGYLLDAICSAPEKKTLEDGVLIVLRELHGTHTISYRNL
jgi:hypothetical protein